MRAKVHYNDNTTGMGNQHAIIFRDSGWPYPNDLNNTLGLTTAITFDPDTGEIYDADTTAPAAIEAASPVRIEKSGDSRVHSIYPTWPWSWPMRAVRFAFLEAIARPLVWLLANPRVVVRRSSRSPPKPVLIVANHVTAFDVPLILFALPRAIRNRVAVAMGAEMLLDWRRARNQGHLLLNFLAPLAYWLVTGLFNVFPLPRAGNFRKSFVHAGRAMDHGFHVLVFPEGVRTRDGRMHAFLGGSGILWKDLHTNALPVYLGGVAEIKVQRSRWFRSGRRFQCMWESDRVRGERCAEVDPAARNGNPRVGGGAELARRAELGRSASLATRHVHSLVVRANCR